MNRLAAQGPQFVGLGFAAEYRQVLPHLGFELVVVRQGRARRQLELLEGTPLGRTVLQAFLDHQTGRRGGDLRHQVITHIDSTVHHPE